MKKTLLAVLCAVAFALTGCTGVSMLNHNSINQTEVVLQKNNYKVVKTVEGTVTSTYVFGIGGYSETSLKDNAVNQMYRNADLKDGQAVININTTVSIYTVLGVYTEKSATAYGTVIQFVD